MSGALCGGILMAEAASNIRKKGATRDNLCSAGGMFTTSSRYYADWSTVGSGLMGMAALE